MTTKRYYLIDKNWIGSKKDITPEFLEDIAFFKNLKDARKYSSGKFWNAPEDETFIIEVNTTIKTVKP